MNVHDLVLDEGSRYHICIYANATTLIHEKWEETLAEVSVCSDGVTVDTEPPIGGHVWVGHVETHSYYQVNYSDKYKLYRVVVLTLQGLGMCT